MSERKIPGCFKYGCLGCLSLIALIVVLIFLFGAVQMSMDTEPVLEQRELAQELPAPPQPPEAPMVEAPPGSIGAPLTTDSPELPQRIDVRPKRGRILLDLSVGNFTIRPGPPGEPIRVEADYDTKAFRLEEGFETLPDGSWVYELAFGPKGGWLGSLLRGGNQSKNELTLVIPRGQPFELAGKIGVGQSETDLGGLWVETVNLDMGIGEHFLEISEPTHEPMAGFAIDSSLGELELRELGNGSPGRIKVEHGIGEMLLDLEGAWSADSKVRVHFGIGECRLWLPKAVHIDLGKSNVSIGEKRIDTRADLEAPADAPRLELDLSGNIGELSVER